MTKPSDHQQQLHYVRGVAHPPGQKHRSYMGNDLRAEEIDFVVKKWRHIPVFLEHGHDKGSIGWVSHFEKGKDGELIAHIMISTKSKLGRETLRGMLDQVYQELSLGQFSLTEGGVVTRIKPAEVTICRKGARDGTSIQWFTDASQKQVLSQIYKSELAARQQQPQPQPQQQKQQQKQKIVHSEISATVDNRKTSKMNPDIDTLKETLQKQQEMLQQLLVQQQQQQPVVQQQQQQQPVVQQQQQAAAAVTDAAANHLDVAAPVQPEIPLEHMSPEQFTARYVSLIKKLGGYAPNGDPEEFVRIVDGELNRQQEQKMEEFRKQVELIHEAGGFGPNVASTEDVVRMVKDVPPQIVGVFASVASNYREKERQYQAAQQELETVKSKVTTLQQKADVLENTLKRTQQVGLASQKERFPSSTAASVQPVAAAAASALATTQTMQNLMRGGGVQYTEPHQQQQQQNYVQAPAATSYPNATTSSSLVYAPPKESIFDAGIVNNSDLARSVVRSVMANASAQPAAASGKAKYSDPTYVGDKVEQFNPNT